MNCDWSISEEKLFIRQEGWVRLLRSLNVEPAGALPVFDRLVAAYSEPHRAYHNLKHIDEMLKTLSRLRDYLTDSVAVELAVWFHDVVYVPQRRDNEPASAERAGDWLTPLGLPVPLVQRVQTLIRATTHTAPVRDGDTAVLLDTDLAILGASEVRYREYAAGIRQEYAFVDESAFRTGRAKVLQALLNRQRIYHTERLYAAGEAAARFNLQRELTECQS